MGNKDNINQESQETETMRDWANSAIMGRPRFEINWGQVDSLAKIQCTGEEVASVLGCSIDTLERHCKEKHKDSDGNPITLAAYLKEKGAGGRASLRRRQFKAAEEGNPTMLIWLGKQYLNQKDKQELDHMGAIQISVARDEDGL